MLQNFFTAKSVAIIGVSRTPTKVGHVVFTNLVDGKYPGKIYIVNPFCDYIDGYKCYKSVSGIEPRPELVVIAVPTDDALKALEECGKNKIKDIVLLTAGFKEINNFKAENKLIKIIKRYKLNVVGPNCLGTFDAHTKLDTLFIPRYRLKRPRPGGISFICQSGAVGSAILDLVTDEGYGFAKFISYGNATSIDESDLLEYLADDDKTEVICLYVEGIKDGRRFYNIAKKISKPIVVLKGGKTEQTARATLSHTGSLAGNVKIYSGVFRQANLIEANSLEEMFDIARLLEKSIAPKGNRVLTITNGGGFGIISTDCIVKNNLKLAEVSEKTKSSLKKLLPVTATVSNPIDLVGDADTNRYKITLEHAINENNVDIILLIVQYQTPTLTPEIVEVISQNFNLKKKPIVIVSTGGEFTESLREKLEQLGIPSFRFLDEAIVSIKHLYEFYKP